MFKYEILNPRRCITTYTDESGLFSTEPLEDVVEAAPEATVSETTEAPKDTEMEEELDEDALLYGDSDKLFEGFKSKRKPFSEEKPTKTKVCDTKPNISRQGLNLWDEIDFLK